MSLTVIGCLICLGLSSSSAGAAYKEVNCANSISATDIAPQQDSLHRTQVDWQARLSELQQELSAHPHSAFLHSQAAVAYDALSDSAGFDREISAAMDLDKGNAIYYYMAYSVFKRRHESKRQSEVLQKALEIDPSNPLGHYEMGSIHEQEKRWSEAAAEYGAAQKLFTHITSDPKNFKNGAWIYIDPRGNPYNVSPGVNQIDEDLRRVDVNLQGGR